MSATGAFAVLSATPKRSRRSSARAVAAAVNDELFARSTRAQFEQLSAAMEDWIVSGDRAIVLLDYLCRNPPK